MFTTASLALENTLPQSLRDPLLGQRLGDYEVHQVVGEGGMGIVYRGVQPVIQKNVAIKVLRREVSGDALLVKRFLGEARAVTAIGHRNIIDVFTMGELADGRPYIVMEFLEGIPLDKYLKERAPLGPLEAVEMLVDIAAPLQAAHAAGIVHRDLKPSNVFLVKQSDGTRYLKLLDFGLAKQSFDGHSAQTSAMMVTGTPDYMSPEQARGAEVSPRSDLYSLGVMAYEMLTGTIPFRGATPMDVLIKHVQAEPQRPSDLVNGIPESLEDLVLSLMRKKATDRPAPAEKVRNELKKIHKELMDGATRIGASLPQGAAAALATPRPAPVVGRKSPSSKSKSLSESQSQAVQRSKLGIWVLTLASVTLLLATLVAWFVSRDGAPEPVVVPAPPVATGPPDTPIPPEPTPPEPTPTPAPTPIAESPGPTPATDPKPKPKPKPKPVESVATLDALSNRITRLENRLKKSAEPGEEPDPAAMVLLKKIKVSLVTSRTQEERNEVQKSLDSWESTFLRK